MKYYEEDFDSYWGPQEYVHKSDIPCLDLMADKLRDIVKQLYSTKPLDKAMLESNLDDLCDMLEVDVNKGDLQIERRGTINKYLEPLFVTQTYPLAQNQ